MKIYIVYSYDNTPFSDEPDYLIRGFFRKDKAEALRLALDKQERKGLAKGEWPYNLHEVRELEVE